jgi:putative ABC transport system permease protein
MGARDQDVIRMIIGHGLVVTLIGILIGVAGSMALTRVMTSLLYEVSTIDPITFVISPLLLIGVALVASYIPARRATKVDPQVALRYQ